MKRAKNITLVLLFLTSFSLFATDEAFLGKSKLTQAQIENWFSSYIPSYTFIVDYYYSLEEIYGVRADLAIAQALHETGGFTFEGEVEVWQNNFSGLYALGYRLTGKESLYGANPKRVQVIEGIHGAVFARTFDGVEAHIQHLYAYGKGKPLPEGQELVDPRYKLVIELVSELEPIKSIFHLGQQENPNSIGWATDPHYGQKILNWYTRIALNLPIYVTF